MDEIKGNIEDNRRNIIINSSYDGWRRLKGSIQVVIASKDTTYSHVDFKDPPLRGKEKEGQGASEKERLMPIINNSAPTFIVQGLRVGICIPRFLKPS